MEEQMMDSEDSGSAMLKAPQKGSACEVFPLD
jgi:hypothetical protein